MLGRPKSAGTSLLRDAPVVPKTSTAVVAHQRRAPALPPTTRLATATAEAGLSRHSRSGSTPQQRDRTMQRQRGQRKRVPGPSAGYRSPPPVALPWWPVSVSSSFSDGFTLFEERGSDAGDCASPTLEAPGATVLGTGPLLQSRLHSQPRRSKSSGQGSRRDSFAGLFNSSPWEQRRREGESTRKMRDKFAEFHAWYSRNATSLIAEWVAVDAATQQQGESRDDLQWVEAGKRHQDQEGGRAWSSYQELCEQCGPVLTVK